MVVRSVVPDCKRVLGRSVNDDGADRHACPWTYLLPLEAHLKIVVELNEVEEVLQDRVGLVLGDTHDAAGEVRVDENRLPTGNRVSPMMDFSLRFRRNQTSERVEAPDNGVYGFQMTANVPRRTALA